ncbi:MAG: 3-hydroxyacyl-CoA dehydrogenase NAD-binding domain-containing protein [bacterium]
MIQNVAVIGSGTMGKGIALVFAQFGYNVELIDTSKDVLDVSFNKISKDLDKQIRRGVVSLEIKESILKRISTNPNINNILYDTDLVIEAIYEDKAAKLLLYNKIDGLTKSNCIFASNTSSISITQLQSDIRPMQFIGMHFMNPVPIMKLVEVIKGHSTNPETYNTIIEVVKSINKIPVPVNDYPGFIANRILIPMINEAIYTVFEGVASIEDVDSVMKLGANHPMGPFELADFIGLDICLDIMNVLYAGFGDPKYRPCPLLKKMVAAKKLGKKSGEGFYKY